MASWMKIKEEVVNFTDEELIGEFYDALSGTAENVLRIGIMYCEIRNRHIDDDRIKFMSVGIGRHLQDIGENRLIPEAYLLLAGNTVVLDYIKTLPLAEQRKVLKHGIQTKTGAFKAIETIRANEIGSYINPRAGCVIPAPEQSYQARINTDVTVTLTFKKREYRALLDNAELTGYDVSKYIKSILRNNGAFDS